MDDSEEEEDDEEDEEEETDESDEDTRTVCWRHCQITMLHSIHIYVLV